MSEIRWIDGHCDTAAAIYDTRQSLQKNGGQFSLAAAAPMKGYAQFFAFCTEEAGGEEPARFSAMYQYFIEQLRLCADAVQLCTSVRAAETAAAEGKVAAFLSMEGAGALLCDPGRLEIAWQMGIRMISLTWNGANALAGSHITGEGLSRQGREFVRRAQRLGMVVDVSHLSERAFWDLCDIVEKPVVASHSNARACCPHSRNLTDAQFRELCQMDGTAGLNLYVPFLSARGSADCTDIIRHLDHFLSMDGAAHVALGGDLDGCDQLPEGISGVGDYPRLMEAIQYAGVSQSLLEQIKSKNLMRVVIECGM